MSHLYTPLSLSLNFMCVYCRHRLAYVDNQLALSLDRTMETVYTANSRISKQLKELDGVSWRDKLPQHPDQLRITQALSQISSTTSSDTPAQPTTAAIPPVQPTSTATPPAQSTTAATPLVQSITTSNAINSQTKVSCVHYAGAIRYYYNDACYR